MNKKFLVFTAILLIITLTFGIGYLLGNIKNPEGQEAQSPNALQQNQNVINNEQGNQTNPAPKLVLLNFGQTGDFNAAGVAIDMEMMAAKKILGKPLKEKKEYYEVTESNHITSTYSFGSVEFDECSEPKGKYFLSTITITDPNANGPREINVGDNIYAVLQKFPDDRFPVKEKERVLYQKDMASGNVFYDANNKIESVSFSDNVGFGSHYLTMEVKEDKVTSISIYVQNI